MMEFPETTSPDERATSGVRAVDYDAELQLHDRAFRRACAIHAHERVLDIGCGAGKTTRDAAAPETPPAGGRAPHRPAARWASTSRHR